MLGVGFALEGIVEVGALVFAEEEDVEACAEVGGDEEGAPALGLADVDVFVVAGPVEGLLVAAEDDVAKGHGGCAAGEEGGASEEEGDQAAVDLDDAADDAGFSAGEAGGQEKWEAQGGGGGSPGVGQEALWPAENWEGKGQGPIIIGISTAMVQKWWMDGRNVGADPSGGGCCGDRSGGTAAGVLRMGDSGHPCATWHPTGCPQAI